MLLPLAFSFAILAPPGPVAPDTVRYLGTSAELEVATPAVERAGISIDGRLDEAVWTQSALLTSFTQFEPVEGAA